MTIYSPTPIRGHAAHLLHYHAFSVDRRQVHCYHYRVDDDVAEKLTTEGKAKQLTGPFACYEERDDGPVDTLHRCVVESS